ncbi:MAG: hypothetical protein K0S12_100 [Bacteroidetes bacterium]|jgi:hypothetical protein|nr:hypothetical protein [Bacteroidota bacterium]
MNLKSVIFLSLLALFGCDKKVGTNPELAYSDLALLDSARNSNHKYYKNDPAAVLNAAGNSPHGSFKLRFNATAFQALTDNNKLPVNGKFPEGSLIVKDVLVNGSTGIYAYMFKRNGAWLWGEAQSDGKFLYTQNNAAICSGCHNQPGHRDLVVSFNYH